jgi:hypothetical protein
VQLIAGVVVLGNRFQNLTTVKNDQEQENRDGKKLRPKTRFILQPALKGLKQRHAPDYGREDNHHELAEHKLSQCHANKIAHSGLGRLEACEPSEDEPTELEAWVRLFTVPTELSWREVVGRSLILLAVVLSVGAAVTDLIGVRRQKINNR